MPQPFNHAIMTNAGANLLLRAQFGEIKIEFTRMSVGNGVYEEEEKSLNSLQERTELKSEKNSYGLSDIHVHSEKSIKITALITNQDPVTGEALIEEGYYINEIGLFAREKGDNDSPEVLYSIAVTSGENGDFMPPYNGFNPAEIIQDYYVTVNNSAEVTIRSDSGAPALADDLQRLYRMVEQQNTDIQEKFLQHDEDLKGYTDTKIGQLINGAPETLDTLKEVADAIQENETVVEALNEAIGTKLNKDGDARDTTVTFTSGDAENPEDWTEITPVESGEKQSSLWRKVSLLAKNVRYLWKLCGTNDISGLADGTLTGAVSKLNTDLGTLGARYLLHLVDEWNSGRKLSFAYTFSAIVMVSGDDAGSHGVFFIQGYGTGRDRIININTVNIGVNLECRLTAEMDVYIRNATVPVGISAFMLLGKLPIVSK